MKVDSASLNMSDGDECLECRALQAALLLLESAGFSPGND